ncbi:UDP-Glycosyltransferase/glycogen phosphorylase [Mycena leptocephala]|nr:UDP-Glycosyltransferase/glycogen phosphorylase [Mycena leptocephala]
MAPNLLEKANAEMSRQFHHGHEALQRISTSQREAIKCATTGTTFDAAPVPVAVIMDMQATRALSGNSTQIIAWVTGGASTIIRLFGPESLGGLGNFGERIDAEARRTGKDPVEIGDKIFKHTDGTVVNISGLPPMYDYEFFPQKLPFEAPVAPIVRGGHTFLMGCDAVIISTAEAYEKVSLDALESWFAASPSLCMLLISRDDAIFKTFLDGMLEQHGEHCIVFISFGTVFWPTVSEYVEELIEALLEKSAPFATGWFLTHGGHGGLMESLSSGVPLICWPFDADQPAAAKHLTQNLNVAFELVEVRTGSGMKPSYGSERVPQGTREAVGSEIRGIIDDSRGEIGMEKRKNTQRLKVELRGAWGEGGPARLAIRAFLGSCT